MRRLLVLAAVAALCACSQRSPAPAAPAPGPASPSSLQPATPPQTNAGPTPAPAQSETEQATRSQESVDEGSEHPARSDASLEKMTSLPAQMPDGKWQAGVNYEPLVPAQPTSVAPGKVEVLEMFWLGCPHCYALEPFIQGWLKSKPPYVEFVRVHVMWGPMHRAHAHFYYAIESLGRPGLFEKAFDTLQQLEQRQQPPLIGNSDDETFRLQRDFAVHNGVSAEEFAKAYNSFSVNSDLQRAEELTQRYHVETVPLIVVNGRYVTDVARAGGDAKLIALINDLATAEHGH
jgi:thiol:disulfide interchange protein DsbA